MNPVVHLELRTPNLPRDCAFFTRAFGWRAESVQVGTCSYLTLELGDRLAGGVVEREAERALWLPYVEVADVAASTANARSCGAAVALEPREGPAGWRSVVVAPTGAEVGLWHSKA